MRDVNLPVRKAFYELLNGEIEYESQNVPVSDERAKIGNGARVYVLLSSQNTVDVAIKKDNTRTAFITLDIVNKTDSAVSKSVVDTVADQILQKVFVTGLTPPVNWQFLNIALDGDRYLNLEVSDTEMIIRRLLTFKITVVQN